MPKRERKRQMSSRYQSEKSIAPPGTLQSKPHRLVLAAIGQLDAANRFAYFPLSQIACTLNQPTDGTRNFSVNRAIRGLNRYGLIKGAAGRYGLTPHGRQMYERMIPSRWVISGTLGKPQPPVCATPLL
jgi:hypothetical protein